ncbi:DegT/DnrJ/EryC1/StrS aminotransferase family protein [Candidatus Marinimicrobia bacterium]|nr:DegT/DnrJ/EryC1/StrS aminotransferase family protein [Candidatus Neomarinimicrobiota bacterium]
MNIKFIDLNKQYKKIKSSVNKDILSTLDKGDFILGDKVTELEIKLADYVGVKECVTCASGTDAILIPLMGENIGIGDVVFTTNFSYFATTEVISIVGATPVFVDIDKKTFNINPELLEKQIKNVKKNSSLIPKAIIAVDIFGQLANYKKIEKIAKKYDLFLIEDAAQSFGATNDSKKSCSFGDVAATSFYPAKPLGCYGDGGAIFTNDSKKAEIYKSIRVHGQGINKYDNIRVGLNSRLDTIQASILLNKMNIFDKELILRKKIADYYNLNLKEYLDIPFLDEFNSSSWAQYSLLVKSKEIRSELTNYLNKNKIPIAIFYKKVFSNLTIYKNLDFNTSYEVSNDISSRIFSIPMHPYLTKKEQNKIIFTIKSFFSK